MQNELLDTLEQKGCAISEMLAETFMGKEDFYVRMLRKLPANTSMDRLKAALDANSAQRVFDASHELKGLYSTLGLSPLWTICNRIVETTRAGSMDGVAADVEALVRAIRANPKLADMPVYAVTADVEIQKTYKSMGFTGIFLKPVTIEMLKNAAPFAGRGK